MDTNASTSSARTARMHLPLWVYKAMLILAAAIWGLGTIAVKDAVTTFPPSWLVGIRFMIAGCILLLVCIRGVLRFISRDTLVAGAFLGVLLALGYLMNSTGLTDTTASKSSFLTATYCVIVPFIAWGISHMKPTRYNLIAAFLCIGGVALVSFAGQTQDFSLSFGDAITLASAVLYALHLAFVSKLSVGRDPMTLTVIQFIVSGFICMAVGLALEGVPDMALLLEPSVFNNLVYLVIFASCIALSLQNIGLAHVPSTQGSLFLATESVFGVVFSVMLLGEHITASMLVGFVLIGGGIIVSETLPLQKKRLDPDEVAREEMLASEGRS